MSKPAFRALGLVGGAALLCASVSVAQSPPPGVVVVTPRPIGAAAKLLSVRGEVSEAAVVALPTEGLVAAERGAPELRTRSDRYLSSGGSLDLTGGSQLQLESGSTRYQQTQTYEFQNIQLATAVATPTATDSTYDGRTQTGSVELPESIRNDYLLNQDPVLSGTRLPETGFVIDAAPDYLRDQQDLCLRIDCSRFGIGGSTGGSGGTGGTGGDETTQPGSGNGGDDILLPPALPPPSNTGGAGGAPLPRPPYRPSRDSLRWMQQQQAVYQQLRYRLEEIRQYREERRARQEEEQRERQDFQGPTALRAINLLEGLHVDRDVELRQNEVLEIGHEIYGDANPQTGLFYYLPRRYDIAWDPTTQYAMTIIYGMAGRTEGEGEVLMAARLRSGIDTHELAVAEDLLRAYLRRHARQGPVRFRELRPAPLEATSDVELFGGAQNEFTVPSEKISVQRVSGFLEAIDVSWATDVRRLLNIESLLRTDAGIHGTVTFHTAGDDAFSRALPLEINVTSPQALGRLRFDRERGWSNQTFYPVRLHALHALLIAPEDAGRVRKDDPLIYSWSLDDSVVAPGQAVQWNAGAVPDWIDVRARLLWVEYSVDGSCEGCDDRVFDQKFIPALPSSRPVVFTTGDAFETTGAERIVVHLRSPFLDPARSRILQPPGVRLEADGEEYTIARLFLREREYEQAVHEPFFEYSLEVTLRDGTTWRSPGWIPSRNLDFLLGSAGIAEALGGRPWEEQEDEGKAS